MVTVMTVVVTVVVAARRGKVDLMEGRGASARVALVVVHIVCVMMIMSWCRWWIFSRLKVTVP